MSSKIRNTFQRVARDGRVGKQDVEQLIRDAMDGPGVTKSEAKTLKKIRQEFESKFTKAGRDAFDRFLSKMNRSWSTSKEVHLPHFDEAQLKELMASDPRIGIYAPRSGGGGKGGSVTTPDPTPVDTAGKGGSTAPADPDPTPVDTAGKGGSSAPVAPDPTPVGGGGKGGSVAPAPTPVAPPVSGSGK